MSPLGATLLQDGSCRFLVWAPHAESVALTIDDPSARSVELEPRSRGYHAATVEGVPPAARYRYRLGADGAWPDPASRHQPEGVHGPSAVVDPAFDWSDGGWTGIPLARYVIYELHVGTFTSEGTLDAAAGRMGELARLGITAVELMPVNAFPGRRNWGYDAVFPFSVHAAYGGPGALRRFVDTCHREGLAVVLDVVHNHLGPEGNVLVRFGPYFTERYRTPWGAAINYDGAGSDEVRRFFIESAVAWIRDYHVDALRLDAVHAIHDASARPFLEDLGLAVHAEGERLGRRVHLVPESDLNDPRLVQRRELGGLGLDAVWCDDFHHALHAFLTGERTGYYRDFGRPADVARAFSDGFVYVGQRSAYRGHRRGRPTDGVPARRFVVFSQNHDQVGNRSQSERLVETAGPAAQRAAAAAVALSPYLPLLFMGEEYGDPAPFPYFVDHRDRALRAAVREGRARELEASGWEAGCPDPSAEETFQAARLDWDLRVMDPHARLLDYYRTLLWLRREIPALAAADRDRLETWWWEDPPVVLVRRWTPTDEAALVLHAGREPARVDLPLPAGEWAKRLDSADARWGGEGSEAPDVVTSSDGAVRFPLPPVSALLFSRAL